MKATEFEYRHQTLVHQLLVAAAVLTYLFDREDIVWRFVKDVPAPRNLERLVFLVATLFVAAGTVICTRALAFQTTIPSANSPSPPSLYRRQYLGDILFSIGLGSLLPLAGFLILVVGDALRVLRLTHRMSGAVQDPHPSFSHAFTSPPATSRKPGWLPAFRRQAVKWGILVTMIVFNITLQDRHADILAAASFLVGLCLNAPIFGRLAVGSQRG